MSNLDGKLPLLLSGRVVKGFGRGSRELGIPTANMDDAAVGRVTQAELPNGVYYGLAQLSDQPVTVCQKDSKEQDPLTVQSDRRRLQMVANIGTCPQYDNPTKSVEVHIIKSSDSSIPDDFYGHHLIVELIGYLRGEAKFESVEALVDQIHQDINKAKELLEGKS